MAELIIRGTPHSYDIVCASSSSPIIVVFVHGWMLSRQYWRPLIEQIRSDYDCLSYDLRGFGQSRLVDSEKRVSASEIPTGLLQPPEKIGLTLNLFTEHCAISPYTPAAYALDLAFLLERLTDRPVWLVGHSLGGTIALWAAAYLCDRVAGVICLNAGGGIYIHNTFEQFRQFGQQLVKVRPHYLTRVPGLDCAFARMMVHRPLARQWGRQRLQDFVVADSCAALGALLDSTTIEEVHLLPRMVASLVQPAYFITGQQDQVIEPCYSYHLAGFHSAWAAGYPIPLVYELPDCGHLGMLEAPAAIAALLHQFITQSQVLPVLHPELDLSNV
jgi:pimeloyl-ACP methyl ester carboxylesterase